MKKSIAIGFLALAFCALGTKVGMSSTVLENRNSVTLQNVEALSDDEEVKMDCKLCLTRICTAGKKDHQFYRNAEVKP